MQPYSESKQNEFLRVLSQTSDVIWNEIDHALTGNVSFILGTTMVGFNRESTEGILRKFMPAELEPEFKKVGFIAVRKRRSDNWHMFPVAFEKEPWADTEIIVTYGDYVIEPQVQTELVKEIDEEGVPGLVDSVMEAMAQQTWKPTVNFYVAENRNEAIMREFQKQQNADDQRPIPGFDDGEAMVTEGDSAN